MALNREPSGFSTIKVSLPFIINGRELIPLAPIRPILELFEESFYADSFGVSGVRMVPGVTGLVDP